MATSTHASHTEPPDTEHAASLEPTVSLDRSRPFTAARARAAGISWRELRGARYRRIVRGVYVEATVAWTPQLEATAALLVSPPGSHASHFTAARIWGGTVPQQPLIHVCSAPGASRSQRQGIRAHECAEVHTARSVGSSAAEVSGCDALGIACRHGTRVSSAARCFLELAGTLDLVDLVVLGDSLVSRGHLTPQGLVAVADQWSGPGAVLARRAARHVRAGVDSPMESRLRMLIVLAGLPEPQVNVILRRGDGSWLIRFELAYPDHLLAVEYDGRHHVEDDATWVADIDRREDLDRRRWRRLTVISSGIYHEPGRTLDRLVAVMLELGVPGVPTSLSDEWRAHFQGRPASYLRQRR